MGYGPHEHVKLILRTLPSGQAATLMVKESTAEHLGWLEHYETEGEWAARRAAEGVTGPLRYRGSPGKAIGGVPLRMGFAEPVAGHPGGTSRQFRIGSKVSLADLAELAHFTEGDWHWMEDRSGRRISRERWLQRYSSIP